MNHVAEEENDYDVILIKNSDCLAEIKYKNINKKGKKNCTNILNFSKFINITLVFFK